MDGMNKGNLIEGQQEGTNLASAGTGSIDAQSTGVGSGMMPGNGKKSGGTVKIIIPAAVLVILVALLVGVALATGVIGSKKKAIMKAVTYTFS